MQKYGLVFKRVGHDEGLVRFWLTYGVPNLMTKDILSMLVKNLIFLNNITVTRYKEKKTGFKSQMFLCGVYLLAFAISFFGAEEVLV